MSTPSLTIEGGIWSPLPTVMHEPDVGIPCVHLVDTMPSVIAVDCAAVGRLNFQPRITQRPQPVIAARRGNILILSVDLIGATATRHYNRGRKIKPRITHSWYFELFTFPEDQRVLLGVAQTEASA